MHLVRIVTNLSCVCAVVAAGAHAQDQASPALALRNGATVVVRQFHSPSVPIPGTERPGAPLTEPGEFQLTFSLSDVQAFHPDGTSVTPAVWQAALEKESPILFGGHAAVGPGQPAAARDRLNLTADLAQHYKPEALVLFGTRSPVKQERVENAHVPKGPSPRFGVAALLSGGWLRVTERQQIRSHYDATFADQPGSTTHVYQTTSTATTRDVKAEAARVWRLDGTSVTASELSQMLAKETSVVVSADGAAPDPFFLRLISSESLVVGLPLPPNPGLAAPGGRLSPPPTVQ